MGQLLNKEFTTEALTAQVDRIEARVRAQCGRTDPQFVGYISANARSMRRVLAGPGALCEIATRRLDETISTRVNLLLAFAGIRFICQAGITYYLNSPAITSRSPSMI